jgi:hypothetical protein
MQKVLLRLPVPRYLKKILNLRFGEHYDAKENTLFGMAIINILKRKSDCGYVYTRNHYRLGNYRFKEKTEIFLVNISLDKARRTGFIFDENRILKIIKAIDKSIRDELYTSAIINKEKYGIEYQTTILDFLDFYDITDEELSYESLRKDFNRNRKKLLISR